MHRSLFEAYYRCLMSEETAFISFSFKKHTFFTFFFCIFFFFFQNVISYFCPLKRDTKIINSLSLYRCKNLLRYYHFNMVNFLQFSDLLDALLNACFSQTLLAFKVVINSSWKRFKVPVDKT